MTDGTIVSDPEPGPLLRTWDVLRDLGFVDDASVPSGGLSFDFGNFKLSAGEGLDRSFRPVVVLFGVMRSPRTLTEVNCEMSPELESREQCIAWVVHCLDSHAGKPFRPDRPVPWLRQGRDCRHLLPWERQKVAYEARPQCGVQRDWARLALRELGNLLATVRDEEPVVFQFDGEVLTIRCAGRLVVAPGSGERWSRRFAIRAENLHDLPKRLTRDIVSFSVLAATLTIHNRQFNGVSAENVEKTP